VIEDLAEARDPEDAHGLLLQRSDVIRKGIEGFGGTVERALGSTIMAVFGANQAHEDDPLRAALAAFKIRDAVPHEPDGRQTGVGLRIGIATGEALVVAKDAATGDQQHISGSVVDISSYLQELAVDNRILP
jgi:class 3 adenylate cyclase